MKQFNQAAKNKAAESSNPMMNMMGNLLGGGGGGGANGNSGNQGSAGQNGNKTDGTPGSAANTTNYSSVAIVPGNNYSVTVPSGGTVTISWDAQ